MIFSMNNKISSHTRGVRNNNPFNIKRTSDNWKGALSRSESTDQTFVQFRSMYFGLRAGVLLLRNYLEMHYDTPREIISRFAPPNENLTTNYLSYVCSFLVEDFDSTFTPNDCADIVISFGSVAFYHLCYAICRYESDYRFLVKDYNQIMSCEFNPKYTI